MDSFNQTNPIYNYNQLVENINNTIKSWNQFKETFSKKLPIFIENLKIRELLLLNISLIIDLLKIKINIGELVSKYIKMLPLLDKVIPYFENLDLYLLKQLEKAHQFLTDNDANKLVQMLNEINPLSVGILGTISTNFLPKIENINTILNTSTQNIENGLEVMSKNLKDQINMTKNLAKTVDTTKNKILDQQKKIKSTVKETKNIAESTINDISNTVKETKNIAESTINDISNTVKESKKISKGTINDISNTVKESKKISKGTINDISNTVKQTKKTAKNSIKKSQSGGNRYTLIHDPIYNNFVDLKSKRGIYLLIKYLDNI
jgi:hypothetical protein